MEQDGYIGLNMLVGQIDSIGLSLFSYMGMVWDSGTSRIPYDCHICPTWDRWDRMDTIGLSVLVGQVGFHRSVPLVL